MRTKPVSDQAFAHRPREPSLVGRKLVIECFGFWRCAQSRTRHFLCFSTDQAGDFIIQFFLFLLCACQLGLQFLFFLAQVIDQGLLLFLFLLDFFLVLLFRIEEHLFCLLILFQLHDELLVFLLLERQGLHLAGDITLVLPEVNPSR